MGLKSNTNMWNPNKSIKEDIIIVILPVDHEKKIIKVVTIIIE